MINTNIYDFRGRKEDLFSSLVTVDLQSEHFNNGHALRRKFEDQINNFNAIGSLPVKSDDFQFQEFEGNDFFIFCFVKRFVLFCFNLFDCFQRQTT